MKTQLRFLFSIVYLIYFTEIQGQSRLFGSDSMLVLTVEGDLRTCIRDRGDDPAYHPISVTVYSPAGGSVVLDMQAKVRGNFRKKPGVCPFPPLKINMKKKQVKGTIFEGEDKLKLVTHCKGKNQAFEHILFQEYLAYRAYQLLTDESFRVRLVEITYVNTGKRPFKEVHHGFLIEDDEALAERLGGQLQMGGTILPSDTEEISSNRLALFQYMIGNTDWSIPGAHNVVILRKEAGTILTCIPYDFDWSGIVNAPYAQPSRLLEIKSVRERLFRGACRPEETWTPVWEQFQSIKEDLFFLYTTFPYLSEVERKKSIRYLEEFYEIIENPRTRKRNILDACRNI